MKCYLKNMQPIRIECGLSQADLAKKTSISTAAISLIENLEREPMLSSAMSIAKALNVGIYELIGEYEYPSNEATARIELTKAQQKLYKIALLCDNQNT